MSNHTTETEVNNTSQVSQNGLYFDGSKYNEATLTKVREALQHEFEMNLHYLKEEGEYHQTGDPEVMVDSTYLKDIYFCTRDSASEVVEHRLFSFAEPSIKYPDSINIIREHCSEGGTTRTLYERILICAD